MWVSHRTKRNALSSWLCSTVFHMLLLLLLMAVGLRVVDRATTSLQSVPSDVGSELVIVDVSIQEPEAQHDPLMIDVIGNLSATSIQVTSPVGEFASGENSSGQDHATAGAETGGSGGSGVANFFGTAAEGNHFVYIVDSSKSMGDEGGRLERAIAELVQSVQHLRSDQYFYVLFFSSGARLMFDEETPVWRQATDENKQELLDWVKGVAPNAGTSPQEALYLGLRLRPSAMFLLSDGLFSRAPPWHRGTFLEMAPVDIVKRVDTRQTPIHTIAFEEPQGAVQLRELAEQTGGTFRYVRTPEKEADRLLRRGDSALRRGKRLVARRYYSRIISEFAQTKAASESRTRLSRFRTPAAGLTP